MDDPPAKQRNRLARPVDEAVDHILGSADAQITLVEYGSYACPNCRAANEAIADIRDRFGDRLRYVFRHRPIADSDLARRAAELVERTDDPKQFWDAHVKLMTRSETLTEEDLRAGAADLGLAGAREEESTVSERHARSPALRCSFCARMQRTFSR